MIIGAAALGNATALQAEPDPIFAALDAHKQAVAALDTQLINQDDLEALIPKDKRRTISAEEIVESDDPLWIAYQQDLDRLSEAEIAAECELASVVPTSLKGVVALLEYSVEIEKGIGFRHNLFDPEDEKQKIGRSWYYFANRNLIESLKALAG